MHGFWQSCPTVNSEVFNVKHLIKLHVDGVVVLQDPAQSKH